ncbi:MAG: hypothetical protein QXL02_00975 [Candidatus Anstonellales archaeon]
MKEYRLAKKYYELYSTTGNQDYLRAAIEVLSESDDPKSKYLLYIIYLELDEYEYADQVFVNLPPKYKTFISALSIEDDVNKLNTLIELYKEEMDILYYYVVLLNTSIVLGREDIIDMLIVNKPKGLDEEEQQWLDEFLNIIDKFRKRFTGEMLEIIMDESYNILHMRTNQIDGWNRMFVTMNVYRSGGTYKIYLPKDRELLEIAISLLFLTNRIPSTKMIDAILDEIDK